MEVNKISDVYFAVGHEGSFNACTKAEATHLAIRTNAGSIFISTGCENFYLLQEVFACTK